MEAFFKALININHACEEEKLEQLTGAIAELEKFLHPHTDIVAIKAAIENLSSLLKKLENDKAFYEAIEKYVEKLTDILDSLVTEQVYACLYGTTEKSDSSPDTGFSFEELERDFPEQNY